MHDAFRLFDQHFWLSLLSFSFISSANYITSPSSRLHLSRSCGHLGWSELLVVLIKEQAATASLSTSNACRHQTG